MAFLRLKNNTSFNNSSSSFSSSSSSSSSSYHQKEFIGKMGFSTMTIFVFVFLLLLGVVSGYHYNISDHTHTHSPWEGFLNLSGCHTGEHRKGLSTVKNYFHKFGYLNTSGNFSDDFDSDLQNALINYQRFFHLNCTGTLDNSTVEFMTLPRCGVSDVVAGSNSSTRGRNLYSYFSGEPTWDKTDLTYAFSTNSPFNHSIYQTVISRAFSRWSEVTTLTFSEVSSTLFADMEIGFYTGEHGDGEPFDGPLGTLAHAFSPTAGKFHLDGDEEWTAAKEDKASSALFSSRTAIDLESVAVHEIGHLLGLAHSTEESAIMYPSIPARSRKVQLANDDVVGIQNLYGRNPNYVPGAPSNSPIPRDDQNGNNEAILVKVKKRWAVVGLIMGLFTFLL